MAQLNVKQTAVALGLFFAILHAIWSALVALGFAQRFVDWKMGIHFMSMSVSVGSFDIVNALILVVFAFVVGAFLGWLFATVWNWTAKKVK